MGVGDSLVIWCLKGEVRCGASRRWSCIIGQMGKSGHGEARQGKAVRGEVRHNKARGMATGVWAKGLQPASLTRIMTGRLLDSKPAAVAAGSKKEERL